MPTFIVNDLDPMFIGQLDSLQTVAANNALSTCCDSLDDCEADQRMWWYPPLNGWSGDPMDIKGMNDAFDRTSLNDSYLAVVDNLDQTGLQGEAMYTKIQLDYIASLERSFRTRQASSVRCRIHAAGRRYGHGTAGGLFDTSGGNIAVWLSRILEAAHYVPSF